MRRHGNYAAVQTQTVSTMNERITDIVAVSALTSPWWLPDLTTISSIAATLIPIMSLFWLVVQILSKLSDWHTKWLEWRIKREHQRYRKIHDAIERQKAYDQDNQSSDNRVELVGSGSGIPGDQGDSWTEAQLTGSEVGRRSKQGAD